MSQQSYPCVFCGLIKGSKSARKAHNKKCEQNVNREKNQVKCRAKANKNLARKSRRKMDAETFDIIFGDLSDGAYFAAMEENGLSVEDFL